MYLENLAYKILGTRDYAKLFLWVPNLLFNIIQTWPGSKYFTINSTISVAYTVFISCLIAYGIYLDTTLNFEAIAEIGFNFCVLSVCGQAIYKSVLIRCKAPKLKILLNEIFTIFWPCHVVNGKLQQKLKDYYNSVLIIMITIVTSSSFYIVTVSLSPLFKIDRVLPFPCGFAFDWKSSPVYEIFYALTTVGNILIIYSIVAVDTLFISVGACAVTQYRILQECFSQYNTPEMIHINENIKSFYPEVPEQGYDNKKEYFVKCYKHHQLLIRFVKEIMDIFNSIALLQLLFSVIGICTAACMFTGVTNLTKEQLLIAFISTTGYLDQLLIYCIIGNELNYQASLLPEYIFKSNWRQLESKSLQKDVMFVLQLSQRIPQLSAHKLYDLNMKSFISVVKLAFSVYTVISAATI